MPALLPDELLYSFIGRVGALNALGNTRERTHLFFGARDVMPITDLPTRLEYLQTTLGTSTPWKSTLELINQATMYPYHRPFLTLERDAAVKAIMLGASGKSLKTLLGRVANRFGAAPPLRFCPTCTLADIRQYGSPYWHRVHQLPGVTVCPTHHTSLVVYSKRFQRSDKQRIILAPGVFGEEYESLEPRTQQISFALLSGELLAAQLPALGENTFRYVYRDAILNLGFRRKGTVDYAGVAASVQSYYDNFQSFPHCERLLSSPKCPLSWLRNLVERPQRSAHPICHLLLIGYLFKSIAVFKQACDASHKRDGSETVRIDQAPQRSIPSDELLRNLSMSCREIAQQTHRSVTTVVNQRRILGIPISERPKTHRPQLLPLVMTMLEKGVRPKQIAHDCRASLSVVYRIRAQFAAAERQGATQRFAQERDDRRRLWAELLEARQGAGLTKIRHVAKSTYAWLYRNDRTWLQAANAKVSVAREPSAKVDWFARDEQLCLRVCAYVVQTRCESARPRISRTLMMQSVGDASVRANIRRLPNLCLLMDVLEESWFAHQCSRINRAVKVMSEVGLPVVNWRVRRMAGVRTWTSAHCQFVDELLGQKRLDK